MGSGCNDRCAAVYNGGGCNGNVAYVVGGGGGDVTRLVAVVAAVLYNVGCASGNVLAIGVVGVGVVVVVDVVVEVTLLE